MEWVTALINDKKVYLNLRVNHRFLHIGAWRLLAYCHLDLKFLDRLYIPARVRSFVIAHRTFQCTPRFSDWSIVICPA